MSQAMPPVLRPRDPQQRAALEFAERFRLRARGRLDGVRITGITLPTLDVRSGDVFVGIPGARRHGAELAAEARERGAVALVTDAAGAEIAEGSGLPLLVVEEPRARLAEMSSWVYGNDLAMPVMLGVTGTNGKTSTVHLQHALLRQLGIRAGMSSSARRHIDDEVHTARLTTPESSELHALLARMRESGVEVMAHEVSAQGIVRHRVDGIVFDVTGFTNLQHDHMDDFVDMDDYLASKLPLFTSARSRRAVVSLDTTAARTVLTHADIPVVTVSTPEISEDAALADTAQWQARMPSEAINASQLELVGPPGSGRRLVTRIPATGPHMVANAAMAIVMIAEAGIPWERIVAVLERDGGIRTALPGRTELVTTGRGPQVYLDFGHTPAGFEMTAKAVRRSTPGRLLILFGADGSRDAGKRPAMGLAAARHSDIAIVTDHHPRWEDAAEIRRGLMEGARQEPPAGGLYEITPPEDAIAKSVSLVGDGDAILWFGPGHQDFREIRGVRTPYDPRGLFLAALEEAGWAASPAE
ncbi:UDP-N-acetylmuramoyl-L-alanyl-D-glutamate--2,6-diaminopimelate ligase [Microbacterium betulae]|uniref:UDP-N-acetylmuramoyl-L-alanyl-D-glutamate--2, 6-diaminopimelate ligase n=1 Tax=Microbacterium betulae TaxID=2981139 RepID=A0AA97FLB1_9MICO|nr:UDP-N-acetylmuramoyl-L-alanyl-D-glutamate--2,6-diaminopimelate ligase [Microbacterium sp. AB]WOF24380.1 UDP-N-acetylmuramoyl-L-alanyl-D-glutamate--2,6-diaminopimelate ligase [Microbacterium sp. AB]